MDINRRKEDLLRFSVPDSPALSFSGKDILDKEPDWNDIKYNLHTSPVYKNLEQELEHLKDQVTVPGKNP